MKVEKKNKMVFSSDQIHLLSGRVFIPEGEPKGIFQIIHGMREHIGLYEDFMQQIAEEGYIVFGYDQLGHGHTVQSEDEYGYISKNNGWKYLVNDAAIFAKDVKRQYGNDLPYTLMGFSMGSFIVRINASEFNWQDKLIIMGTGGYVPQAEPGLAMIKTIKNLFGDHYVSDVLETLVFGTYNEKFPDCGELGWLSSLEEKRKLYENDPLCSFHFTVAAMEDLIQLSVECNRPQWYSSIDKSKPILLISGSEDPLGEYGEGITRIYDQLREKGANVDMKLYQGCRHAILEDSCRNEVINDIKSFLEK